MYVKVGNEAAIEIVTDPLTGEQTARELPGQRVTKVVFPEGMDLTEAFLTTVGALKHHMKSGATPTWIDTDSDELKALLKDHYGMLAKEMRKAPRGWGKDTGADVFLKEK